ncbi:MAG: hypothetical protein ACJ8AT_27600 [Hyalangium sp.]|uniref:hypothetical protein n=1 Tax=Hyalangium sp. TaxID=2028555 RepID=UPI00389A64EA
MKTRKKNTLQWLLALSVGGAILGGTLAYAQMRECWECYPCGCSPDGSALLCCSTRSC